MQLGEAAARRPAVEVPAKPEAIPEAKEEVVAEAAPAESLLKSGCPLHPGLLKGERGRW